MFSCLRTISLCLEMSFTSCIARSPEACTGKHPVVQSQGIKLIRKTVASICSVRSGPMHLLMTMYLTGSIRSGSKIHLDTFGKVSKNEGSQAMPSKEE